MKKEISVMLNKCLGLKGYESCLIVTDNSNERKEIARILFDGAGEITQDTELLIIAAPAHDAEEPDDFAAQKMAEYNVVIIATEKSLTHTNARKNASSAGARIISMPGITKEIIMRTIDVDYEKMRALTNKIADALDKGKEARIQTKSGTDILLPIDEMIAHGRKAGIFLSPGDYGNLPEAEAFISPNENKTEGFFVADASIAGIGLLDEKVIVEVKNGYATKISGGSQAERLNEMLLKINDKRAFNIAELGIGTNPKAKITGCVLEDEKALGTCHIALGNNSGFGGTIDVPIHIDCVIKEPTITIDNTCIMKNGKIVL